MKRKIYIDGRHWDNILALPCVRGLNKRGEGKDRVQLALLDRRIEDLQNLCSLLEKSGDKKSADNNVVPKLNEAVKLRDKLLQEADKNRRQADKCPRRGLVKIEDVRAIYNKWLENGTCNFIEYFYDYCDKEGWL